MQTKTQCDLVITHLLTIGPLTSWEAMKEYGIMRLPNRIMELKRKGFDIIDVTIHDTNRYGAPVKYKEYYIERKSS